MTSTIQASEQRVEFYESKERLLQQANEEILQRSMLLQKIQCTKSSLVGGLPKKFIGIAVRPEDTIHKWCEKEVLELAHFKKLIQRNMTSRSVVLEERNVECQDSSKIVPCSSFLLSSQGNCFIWSETVANLIVK